MAARRAALVFGILLLLAVGAASGDTLLDALSDFASKEDARTAFQEARELLSPVVARSAASEGLRPLFDEWKKLHKITYAEDENEQRYGIFLDNVRHIIATNDDPTTTHWEGLNRYSAMTPEEFSGLLMDPSRRQQQPDGRAANSHRKLGHRSDLPEAKDWGSKITGVRDQGNCGCCWAFAGVAAIEAHVKIATGQDYDFSEQQLVDCKGAAWACTGGYLYHGFAYAYNKELFEERAYPYKLASCSTAQGATCDSSPGLCPARTNSCATCRADSVDVATTTHVKLSSYANTGWYSTKETLMDVVANKGPVAVTFAIDFEFQFYKGGVITKDTNDSNRCSPRAYHAALLVGYNSTADPPFWRLKNSMGSNWGESGYFRMSLNDGTDGPCQMYQEGGYFPTDPIVTPAPKVAATDLCANVTCNNPCKTGGRCNSTTGSCRYSGSAPKGTSCSAARIPVGVCSGFGSCRRDRCVYVTCNAACKTGASCNPFDGTCSYTGNATAGTECSTSTAEKGQCDSSGTCKPLVGSIQKHGLTWAQVQEGGNCSSACEALNFIAVPDLCAISDNELYMGWIDAGLGYCRGLAQRGSAYSVFEAGNPGYLCGCSEQPTAWTARGSCPSQADLVQSSVCRVAAGTGNYCGWTGLYTGTTGCFFVMPAPSTGNLVGYCSDVFDYMCTSPPAVRSAKQSHQQRSAKVTPGPDPDTVEFTKIKELALFNDTMTSDGNLGGTSHPRVADRAVAWTCKKLAGGSVVT